MPAVGGSPRRITSLPAMPDAGLGAPQWSSDGEEISVPVFDAPRCYAEIVRPQTQASRRVPLSHHEGSSCFELSWSPDGAFFAYVDADDWASDVTRIWVVSSSGGDPIPVSDGRTNDWNPTWSPDGRHLFFLSNRGGAMDLWRQRVGKGARPQGEPVPLTSGIGIRTAAFSRDLSRVAYSRGQRFLANLWRVPILTDRPATWADAEQITFDNAWAESMDVSPDGKRLVVSSDRTGNKDLWILPSEGGHMTQLTTDSTPEWAPRWSPDGTEIVFYAYRSGNRDIWVMPAEGGPARQITSHPSWDAFPEWSPDGREIAFSSRRSGNADVWIVAAGAGDARQITRDVANDGYPIWSPDGDWLLFESSRDGQTMWRVRVAGGEPERLIRGRDGGIGARFSPDGKILYFSKPTGRDDDLWALSLKDESEYKVTDFEGRPGKLMAVLATDGTYLYFPWRQDLGDIWVMDVESER